MTPDDSVPPIRNCHEHDLLEDETTHFECPVLLAPSDSTESTPDTSRTPESDVQPFDLSEFITFSPTPEP